MTEEYEPDILTNLGRAVMIYRASVKSGLWGSGGDTSRIADNWKLEGEEAARFEQIVKGDWASGMFQERRVATVERRK